MFVSETQMFGLNIVGCFFMKSGAQFTLSSVKSPRHPLVVTEFFLQPSKERKVMVVCNQEEEGNGVSLQL